MIPCNMYAAFRAPSAVAAMYVAFVLLVAARLHKSPEALAKLRRQDFHMQNNVEVFGAAKGQARFCHGQGGGRAANQDVLVFKTFEPFLKNRQPFHHGNCASSSSSAICTRSSWLSCR